VTADDAGFGGGGPPPFDREVPLPSEAARRSHDELGHADAHGGPGDTDEHEVPPRRRRDDAPLGIKIGRRIYGIESISKFLLGLVITAGAISAIFMFILRLFGYNITADRVNTRALLATHDSIQREVVGVQGSVITMRREVDAVREELKMLHWTQCVQISEMATTQRTRSYAWLVRRCDRVLSDGERESREPGRVR
jgi:hypothetical protein